jgi:Family of unknown function (DUF6454)
MRVLAAFALAAAIAPPPADSRSIVGDRVMKLTRASAWTRVASIPIGFRTYHPQGMVKIGETLFVSSVDAAGEAGHLFKMTMAGALVADLRIGEGAIFHPGGIDYDGAHIWVPVAEYRPDSRSIIYRVDPNTMTAVEVFRFADHVGAIVHNPDDRTLHGVSWGSRRFYRWPLDANGRLESGPARPDAGRTLNASHYVDYQDCKYAGRRRMLCTGVTELRQTESGPPFRLGGIDLVDLADGRPLHQVPVLLWTADGLDMTHNPVWIEPSAAGLRAYFMPEDDASTLYVYDVGVT